jgi:gephyrin
LSAHQQVRVFRKPIVAVMSTGDEISDVQTATFIKDGGMWDTNRPSLIAVLQGMGYDVVDLGIVPNRFCLFSLSLSLCQLYTPH